MTANDVATEIRRQLGLHNAAPFNLKYIDVEGTSHNVRYMYKYPLSPPPSSPLLPLPGDPVSMSLENEREWDEATRLYYYNQDKELLLHG